MQALSELVLPYCGVNMLWCMVKLQRSSYRKMNLLLRIQPLYVGIANDHFQILLIKKSIFYSLNKNDIICGILQIHEML